MRTVVQEMQMRCTVYFAITVLIAYVASVSARVRRERWDESKKKGMTGEGEGREGNACPQTPRF